MSATVAFVSPKSQPPTANSLKTRKSCRHWLEFPKDDNARPLKLILDDSSSCLEVVPDLPVAMGLSFGSIASAILDNRIHFFAPQTARSRASHDVGRTFVTSYWIRRLTEPPSSALERSARIPPEVVFGAGHLSSIGGRSPA